MPIPIIDLFAGPGGLSEGFASLRVKGQHPFEVGLSVEMDPVAHKTLSLRSVFRKLRGSPAVRHYYDYVAGRIKEKEFRAVPAVAAAFELALKEARCLELGVADAAQLDADIATVLNGTPTWVLIGGPPCQAYSLAGRSRRRKDVTFANDAKHFLYKEYLRIIRKHKPPVFVMENVTGLLSSSHSGDPMFERIIADLSKPSDDLEYEIRSFVKRGHGFALQPRDYVVQAENHGVPQSRHRVFLLGVRKDLTKFKHRLLGKRKASTTVQHAIGSMPRIRSRLSGANDSAENWLVARFHRAHLSRSGRDGSGDSIYRSVPGAVGERVSHDGRCAHRQGWSLLHSLRSRPVPQPDRSRGCEATDFSRQLFLRRESNSAIRAGGKCGPTASRLSTS